MFYCAISDYREVPVPFFNRQLDTVRGFDGICKMAQSLAVDKIDARLFMTTQVLDAAYALAKEAEFGPYPSKFIAKLRQQFPEIDEWVAEDARAKADSLVSAACEWAEQYRGPANDGNGVPSFQLADRCPGFSDAIYSDAEAWGLYLTK
jgi:hypothetical protein